MGWTFWIFFWNYWNFWDFWMFQILVVVQMFLVVFFIDVIMRLVVVKRGFTCLPLSYTSRKKPAHGLSRWPSLSYLQTLRRLASWSYISKWWYFPNLNFTAKKWTTARSYNHTYVCDKGPIDHIHMYANQSVLKLFFSKTVKFD